MAGLPELGRFAPRWSKPARPEVCIKVMQTAQVTDAASATSAWWRKPPGGASRPRPPLPRGAARRRRKPSQGDKDHPQTTDRAPPVADRQPMVAGVCGSTQLTVSRRISLWCNGFSHRCEGGDSLARAYTHERRRGENAIAVHGFDNNFSCALRKNYLYSLYYLPIISKQLTYLLNYFSTTTTNYLQTIANYCKRLTRPPRAVRI